MSFLPKTKWGDCSRCTSKNVACVKVAKDLVCVPCHRKAKGKEQVDKAQQREKLRRGGNTKTASERLGRSLRLLAVTEPDVRAGKDYGNLRQWFMDRRREMDNVCCECGGRTNRDSDKYYKWSICHIAPKALVPSVATDINNWVELCWLHHQEFDSTFDRAAAMQCFGEVKQKFQLFKHLIPPEELRKVNPHLLK